MHRSRPRTPLVRALASTEANELLLRRSSMLCVLCAVCNLQTDPGEHIDMAPFQSSLVTRMLARFKQLETAYHPRVVSPPLLKQAFCDAAIAHAGFTAPYCKYAPAGAECE